MPLDTARTTLKKILENDSALTEQNADQTLIAIAEWFSAYKVWEAQDRFVTAIRESRMTMRQAPEELTYGAYKGKESGAGFQAKPKDAPPGEGGTIPYPSERYRVGLDSIKQKLNPDSFGRVSPVERTKYTHGLHDLSGTLMTPHIWLITDQVRWKHEGGKLDTWMYVFMPLPKPEDINLFDVLNTKSKQSQTSPRIRSEVIKCRNSMTRLKLAANVDIGSGLRNIAEVGDPVKLRYGVSQPLGKNGALDPIDSQRRVTALTNYQGILPTQEQARLLKQTPRAVAAPAQPVFTGQGPPPPPPPPAIQKSFVNEVVISFRQHAGHRFPIFAKWDGSRGVFKCLEDVQRPPLFTNDEFPDEWAKAVEL